MKPTNIFYDGIYCGDPPTSAFYRGKPRSKRTTSFEKTHITQQKLDNQRLRKERRTGK